MDPSSSWPARPWKPSTQQKPPALRCGFIGCTAPQGEGHALQHFESSSHAYALDVPRRVLVFVGLRCHRVFCIRGYRAQRHSALASKQKNHNSKDQTS